MRQSSRSRNGQSPHMCQHVWVCFDQRAITSACLAKMPHTVYVASCVGLATIHSVGRRFVRVESVTDLAPSPTWVVCPRDGFLWSRAAMTWTGIRTYHFADGPKRVLRRWEQVGAPGHLDTLRRLTATPGHPTHRGAPVNITRDNARRFLVGFAGGNLEAKDINGFTVPVGDVTITSAKTMADIEGGATQTSLGYTALIDTTGGMWDGPDGPAPFDFEHVLDPLDPRVLELVEATANDEHPFLAESLGGNHFAVGIARGRGAELSELVSPLDSEAHAHTPPKRGARCQVFMYRDAAGIDPTPIQEQDQDTDTMADKKLIQVPLVIDGLKLAPRTVDIDEETRAQVAAFMRETGEAMRAMADKLEGVEKELDEANEKVETAEGAQAEMATETEEMRDSLAKTKEQVTALETEVAPLRATALDGLRETAKLVHDADYSKHLTADEVKAAAVTGKTGAHEGSPTVVIDALFDTFVEQCTDAANAAKPKMRGPQPKARRFNVKPTHDDRKPQSRGRAVLANINNERTN